MKIRHPEGEIQYRKDVFTENARYNSLTILEMNADDRDYAFNKAIKINSGVEAQKFVAQETLKAQEKNKQLKWAYEILDMRGRIGVLKYLGVEVAEFFHRQLSSHRISIETPLSELRLKDPVDAWMRIDLSGLSAKQAKRPTVNLIHDLEKKLETTETKLKLKEALIESFDRKRRRHDKHRKKKGGRKAKSRK